MDKQTAFEVEAALIDAYPGLTNMMDGYGNSVQIAIISGTLIRQKKLYKKSCKIRLRFLHLI